MSALPGSLIGELIFKSKTMGVLAFIVYGFAYAFASYIVVGVASIFINCKPEVIFKWYDFWIGIYYDRKNKCAYLFFVPMLGLKIQKC